MTIPSSYPVRYGSPRRDSMLAVVTAATGKVTWSQPVAKPSTPNWPPTVLVWGDRPVVATASDLDVFDAQGQRLWTRTKQAGTPAAVADGRLYFKGKSRLLDALDAAGILVLEESPFPNATTAEERVDLFWPRQDDFVAVVGKPGDSEVAEGDPPDTKLTPARLVVMRNRYPITYGDWQRTYKGRAKLAPLFEPERQVVALLFDEVIRIDVAQRVELSRFKVPLDALAEWSVDTEEHYGFTGYQGQGTARRKSLLIMSPAGKELWRWTDGDADHASETWAVRQPPIRAKGGRVYALTQGRVLAIEQGKLVWQYDTRSDSLQHGAKVDSGSFEIKDGRLLATGSLRHGSVLGDGSLLITGGKTLHHLSAEGRKLFSISVDADILSPPVVDADGHIYVATATHLIRID